MPNTQSKGSDFVSQVRRDVEEAARVLRTTGTLLASGIRPVYQRVPGEEKVVAANFPGNWASDREIKVKLAGFDGTVYEGDSQSGSAGTQFAKLFQEYPKITTVIHAHTVFLSTWANAQRNFPLRDVAAQRHTLSRELPAYIDRRTSQADFIRQLAQ
jgi:L-ribulose-5-phosphate 4-epimerase